MANLPPIHNPEPSPPRRVRLSRELRFGLHEIGERGADPLDASNGFAGNPSLLGMAPFLTLVATVAGIPDPQTGMLINVKEIDTTLRSTAVPLIRNYFYAPLLAGSSEPRGAGDLLLDIFHQAFGEGEDGRFYTHAFAPHRVERLMLALSPYLTLAIDAKDSAMVQLSLRFEFSAAHRLHCENLSEEENRVIFGRCNNPNGHGHNYELEVTVSGTSDQGTGQVIPIHLLQRIVNEQIISPFDHKHLNLDCVEFLSPGGENPTVVNIAAVLFARLKPNIPPPATLAALRLWETPKTMCEISV